MSNQANVDALEYLIAEAGGYGPDPPKPYDLAVYLAARGVLVPGALTDEECASATDKGL